MRQFSRLVLSVFVVLSLLSCSHTSNELKRAEQLMTTSPDSALHVLQKLKPNLFTARSDKALYSLLMSQALDKNDIKVESDSLITIATNFFDENEPIHAGYAWFYCARCANARGDAKTQAAALLNAQNYAEKAENHKLSGLVYFDKGSMYFTQKQFKKSISYFISAYNEFLQIKDYRNCILSLLNVGYNYVYTPAPDKAINSYLSAEQLFRFYKDTLLLSTVYRSLGGVYYQKENYIRALEYYHKVPLTHQPIYDSNKWFLIANVFYKIGNLDSTCFYLNKVTELKEMAPDYYRLWQTTYEKKGNNAKALFYSKKVALSTDSLYIRKLDISFAGLETKYKFQNLKIANQKLIIKDKQNGILLLIALFVLSLGVIVFLFWRNRVKNYQLKVKQQLLEKEIKLVEKEKENINLLEQQINMQNILLSNVEQYRNHSVKRPDGIDKKRHGVSPILNQTFHDELIACMDIQYNNISKRLKTHFSDLTERDILICCLLLAEFESGMIATILDVKNDSIRIHRTRLRKKLGLENSENLTLYLRHF